jgi:hypothetical protein
VATEPPFPCDPRTIPLADRRACAAAMAAEGRRWRARLQALAESPPADDFPFFLLATPPFARLRAVLERAATRADLPMQSADELDYFVAAYRDYLRTCAGEDVFCPPQQRRA